MKKALVFILTFCFLGGVAFIWHRYVRETREDIFNTFAQAQEYDLKNQFEKAFEHEEALRTISFGTNLLRVLENGPSASSKEGRASRALIHARLSALYNEAGLKDAADKEAEKARLEMVGLSPGLSLSPSHVVKGILERNRVKRSVLVN